MNIGSHTMCVPVFNGLLLGDEAVTENQQEWRRVQVCPSTTLPW